MIGWVASRVLQAAAIVLILTGIVFAGLHVIGNPVDILISPQADQAERMRAAASLGLDRPILEQYGRFLLGLGRGDLGRSFAYDEPALRLIAQRLPATLELALAAVLIAATVGIPIGVYAGLHPDRPGAKLAMTASVLGFSLPAFWVGLMMIFVFAVQLGWLPSTGRGATVPLFGVPVSFLTVDGLRHLAMPAFNLALFNIALILRLTEAGVREAMASEFVHYARAKGLAERRIVLVHVMRMVLIPVTTALGLELGTTIAYSVVTETVFAWPGMGKLIVDSIYVLDRPVIVAYLLMTVLLFVSINLAVDLLHRALDPRIRASGRR